MKKLNAFATALLVSGSLIAAPLALAVDNMQVTNPPTGQVEKPEFGMDTIQDDQAAEKVIPQMKTANEKTMVNEKSSVKKRTAKDSTKKKQAEKLQSKKSSAKTAAKKQAVNKDQSQPAAPMQ